MGKIAVCVGLGDNEAGLVIVALVDQPTGRFGTAKSVSLMRYGERRKKNLHEWQNENTHKREDPLEE